jgi:hypothetical protein
MTRKFKKFKDLLKNAKFNKEKKRQIILSKYRYQSHIEKDTHSYWLEITNIPPVDISQRDALSEFAKTFISSPNKDLSVNFTKRAPEDIYPVF